MKTSRYTEAQIIAILRQAEGGLPVSELCREHGMSDASFYKWRDKYGGMDASMVSQMKAMEEENRRLKRMYADLSMQADLLKEGPSRSLRLQVRIRFGTMKRPARPRHPHHLSPFDHGECRYHFPAERR